MRLYKYQGAGNDFLIADNRDGSLQLSADQVARLCDRRYGIGADGLMLLDAPDSPSDGFRMTYFNSDGSGGMMCGNGGRCIVAFAADMGIENFSFAAADGHHQAEITASEGKCRTVRLQMKDVCGFRHYESLDGVAVLSEGYFLDTGTRHYVRFVSGLESCDVVSQGRDIRYNALELQPVGVNVNFVEPYDGGIKVRTYEKGVEDETYACGTGIVASCIASYLAGVKPSATGADGSVVYDVKAKRDSLSVEFLPSDRQDMVATKVYLVGPAVLVAEINIDDV